jgi:hypothetical protein
MLANTAKHLFFTTFRTSSAPNTAIPPGLNDTTLGRNRGAEMIPAYVDGNPDEKKSGGN